MKKTTIELPEPLFRRAKVFAAREGTTFRSLIIEALESELARAETDTGTTDRKYWVNRTFLPEYDRFRREGAYSGGTDSTVSLSEDRDDR